MPLTFRRLHWPVMLAAAAALGSCGRANSLEGSLVEVVTLGFQEVEVARGDTAVSISYFTKTGTADQPGRDIVLRLVVHLTSVQPNVPFDLAPDLDGNRKAEAVRSVVNDPVHAYAPVVSGAITFDQSPDVEKPASGTFHVFFGDGGDAGKGRTAYGSFTVKSVVAAN